MLATFLFAAALERSHAKPWHMEEALRPPIWPDGFSVEFHEILNASSEPFSTTNTGRWFYDWAQRRSRFDHDAGQRNDFCQLAFGISPKHAQAPSCRLYFTERLEMWVSYPERRDCCSLCWPNPQGFPATCSSMRPDWLVQNSSCHGQVLVDGKSCAWWSKHGAVADDNWFVRPDGVPCAYKEHYRASGANIDNITDHEIRFDPSTYVVGRPDARLFDLPSYCNRNCSFRPLEVSSKLDFALTANSLALNSNVVVV